MRLNDLRAHSLKSFRIAKYLSRQQFAFKPATNKNIKLIVGLRPATFLVAGLLEHGGN